jgi:uncharacterized membrane protein YeaQ/YmgE (transglycosylase-associated protein family)
VDHFNVIAGLIVGAVARFLIPGRDPMGCLMTSLLGVSGSFVGGFVATLLWGGPRYSIRPAGFVLSVIGAMLLLLLWRVVRRHD